MFLWATDEHCGMVCCQRCTANKNTKARHHNGMNIIWFKLYSKMLSLFVTVSSSSINAERRFDPRTTIAKMKVSSDELVVHDRA